MAYDTQLADRLVDAVADRDVTTREMFGGFAVMLNGNMLAGVVGTDLMVRVGPDAYESLLAEPDAKPMEFTHRPMKGMLLIEGDSVAEDRRLGLWVHRAQEFVATLPAK